MVLTSACLCIDWNTSDISLNYRIANIQTLGELKSWKNRIKEYQYQFNYLVTSCSQYSTIMEYMVVEAYFYPERIYYLSTDLLAAILAAHNSCSPVVLALWLQGVQLSKFNYYFFFFTKQTLGLQNNWQAKWLQACGLLNIYDCRMSKYNSTIISYFWGEHASWFRNVPN